MSETTIKRVTITNDNLDTIKTLAENKGIKLSDYLDKLMNQAIIEEEKKQRRFNPLYLWKS